MKNKIKQRIGEKLVEDGKITQDQLEAGLEYQRKNGFPLGKILEHLGFVSEVEIIEALSRQLGVPYIDLLEEASEKLLKKMKIY